MTQHQHLKRFQYIYFSALGFIGLVALSFFLYISNAIEKNKAFGEIINIAGKQRMLSQRTSLLAVSNLDEKKSNKALQKLLLEMQTSHAFLSCVNLDVKCDPQVQLELDLLLSAHIRILESKDRASIQNYLDKQLIVFLNLLDQRVKSFEEIAAAENDQLIFLEKLILFIVLVVILLEAFFVFRPILLHMHETILKAGDAERSARLALDQNEKLLGSISHYFKTPLNQLLYEIKNVEPDNGPLNKSYDELQASLTHILDFYKTTEEQVFKLVPADYLKSKIPHEALGSLKDICNQHYLVNTNTIIQLITSCVDLAKHLNIKIEYSLQSEALFHFQGDKESLEMIVSSLDEQNLNTSLSLSRLTKELRFFDWNKQLTNESLFLKVLLESVDLPLTKNKSKIGKVLIVDDQEINIKIMKNKLSKLGIECIEARNGKEAIQSCNNDIQLVFMDIKMPVMGGFEATTEINKKYPKLPIVFVSANDFCADIKSAIDCGGSSFISKPVTDADIIDEIKFFENYENQIRIQVS